MSASGGAMLPADTGDNQELEAVELLIDQMGEQSFPASDPPAWGVLRARLDLAREVAQRHRDIAPAE